MTTFFPWRTHFPGSYPIDQRLLQPANGFRLWRRLFFLLFGHWHHIYDCFRGLTPWYNVSQSHFDWSLRLLTRSYLRTTINSSHRAECNAALFFHFKWRQISWSSCWSWSNPYCMASWRWSRAQDLQLPPAFALYSTERVSRATELAYERDFSYIPYVIIKQAFIGMP